MKRLSIIIVTYNSEDDIYDCLASIRQHSDLPLEDIEIIVVDNNSKETDKMFTGIRNQFGNDITLIKNIRNGGYGQGNNVGIRNATAPVILIMNPDVRLMEPVLATAVHAFEDNHQLGIYGIKQMLSPTIPSSNSFGCTYMMNGYLSTILTAVCNRTDHFMPKLMQFSGACFFIRKKMFEEVGLFDETNFMYGEEDDISWRMRKQYGTCLQYNPLLHYIHLSKDRKPDLEYEKKLINVAAVMNEKKGYPTNRTLRNRLQSTNVQLWREWLRLKMGKKDTALYDMLSRLRQYLKQQLSSCP